MKARLRNQDIALRAVHADGIYRRMRGVTLVEILAALAIGTLALMSVTAMVIDGMDDSKAQQAAFHHASVGAAAAKYIGEHYADLVDALGKPGAKAALAIGIDQLKSAGYFPDSFSAVNAYGQTPCLLVRQPEPGKLDALLVTEQGEPIPARVLNWAAANVGQSGGYLSIDAGKLVARSAFNAWSLSAADLAEFLGARCTDAAGTAGRLATALFYDDAAASNAEVLYRNAEPGHPELNFMRTALRLHDAETSGVEPGMSYLSAERQDLLCSPTDPATWGKVAADAQGGVLSCQSGAWTRQGKGSDYWREPVSDYGALAALPPEQNGDGDVRLTLDQNRPYIWKAAIGKWVDLYIDKAGNTTIFNRLTTNDLVIDRIVTVDDACAPEQAGAIARDDHGLPVSCRSGKWQAQPSHLNLAVRDSDCAVILASAQPDAVVECPHAYSGPMTWEKAHDTWTTSIKRSFVPAGTGLVSANAWSDVWTWHKVKIYLQLVIIDNDTGSVVGRSEAQSPQLSGLAELATSVNARLMKEIPKNGTGYSVEIRTSWTTMDYSGSGDPPPLPQYYSSDYLGPAADTLRYDRIDWADSGLCYVDTSGRPRCNPQREFRTPLTTYWNLELYQ